MSDCKKPDDAAKLRILDPSCGSGSFLIAVYDALLKWHIAYYRDTVDQALAAGKKLDAVQKANKAHIKLHQLPDGNGYVLHLTVKLKQAILKNSIFGVDLDPQAVEVTRFSLSMKAVEDATHDELYEDRDLFKMTILPDLSGNIKQGNSLVAPVYTDLDGQTVDIALRNTAIKIRPFDWKTAFSQVFSSENAGFDVVLGNPPYIRIQTMKEWAKDEVELYKGMYKSAGKGNYDIYVVFVEKGLSLLNRAGRLGYILPHKFFNAKYGEPLRKALAEGKHLAEIVHYGDKQIFENATTYTCLLFLDKAGRDEFSFEKVDDLGAWRRAAINLLDNRPIIAASAISSSEWNFNVGEGSILFERLHAMPKKLGDVAERMAQGIRTSADEVYVLDLVSEGKEIITAYSKQLDRNVKLERKSVSLFLQGKEIKPYKITPSGKVVIIPYRTRDARTEFITKKDMQDEFPKTFEYLKDNKSYLEDRENGKMRGSNWYAYVYPKNIEIMGTSKILVPDIADRACFAYDEQGEYAFTSGYAITLKRQIAESPKYMLGLLNSKLLNFYLKRISTPMRGGFFRYFTQYIERLPIRTLNFDNAEEKAAHDSIVTSVNAMLKLHRDLAAAETESDEETFRQLIASTDARINALVYKLYDLTPEEIAIVEG